MTFSRDNATDMNLAIRESADLAWRLVAQARNDGKISVEITANYDAIFGQHRAAVLTRLRALMYDQGLLLAHQFDLGDPPSVILRLSPRLTF